MGDYKELDLLPCPWCLGPTHVEKVAEFGYMATCGRADCNCPSRVIYPAEATAKMMWNCGATIEKIQEEE